MKLNRFKKKLYEEKLSSKDNSRIKEIKKEINDYIRDENLDEMDVSGTEFLDYSRKVKDKIDDLIENKKLDDPEEVRHQLYGFFEIK